MQRLCLILDLFVHAEAKFHFKDRGSDWGFTKLAETSQITDPNAGFISDNHLTVRVKMECQSPSTVLKAAKKETRFIGLENQGAICHINPLLQILYNINIFRQASTFVSLHLYGMHSQRCQNFPTPCIPQQRAVLTKILK